MIEPTVAQLLLFWLVFLGISWVSSFMFVVLASYVVCKIVKNEFFNN